MSTSTGIVNFISKAGIIEQTQTKVTLIQNTEIILLPFQNKLFVKDTDNNYIEPKFGYAIVKENYNIVLTILEPLTKSYNYLFLTLAINNLGQSIIPTPETHYNQNMYPTMTVNLSKSVGDKFLSNS